MKPMAEIQIKERADFGSNDLITNLEGMNDGTDLKTDGCTNFPLNEGMNKSEKLKKSEFRIHERRCHRKETSRTPRELKSTEQRLKHLYIY